MPVELSLLEREIEVERIVGDDEPTEVPATLEVVVAAGQFCFAGRDLLPSPRFFFEARDLLPSLLTSALLLRLLCVDGLLEGEDFLLLFSSLSPRTYFEFGFLALLLPGSTVSC